MKMPVSGNLSVGKQRGAVLLVSLIMLLVMTIIGTSSMNSVTLEEKMVSNMYDENMSFQAAESGLRDCEEVLLNVPDRINPQNGTNGFWQVGGPEADQGSAAWWEDASFFSSNSVSYESNEGTPTNFTVLGAIPLESNPTCIREELTPVLDDKSFAAKAGRKGWERYRLTSKASGADARTSSTVQGTFLMRYR